MEDKSLAMQEQARKIEVEKKALDVLIQSLEGTDGKDREMVVAAIQKQAEILEITCESLQKEADEITATLPPPAPEAFLEILLTEEQKQRVKEKTGVDVPSIRLKDPTGDLTKHMEHIEPSFVEEKAMEQANLFNELVAEAEAAAAEEAADEE